MEFILREQSDILKVTNELMNVLPLIKEKPYICEIKPYKEKRSLDANAYFHVLVDKIAKALNANPEEVKIDMNLDYGTYAQDKETGQYEGFEALKKVPVRKFCKYAKPIREYEKNGKTYVQYLIRKHTSDLESHEMAKLIDGVIQEAQNLGIETMTPLELETLKGYKGE